MLTRPLLTELDKEHLLLGGPADRTRANKRCWRLLKDTLTDGGWDLTAPAIRQLSKAARNHKDGDSLADSLDRIRTCELTLGPAVALFDLILGRDRQTISALAHELRESSDRR